MLNQLVSGSQCAKIATQIDLGPYIRLGKQALNDGTQKSKNVLGDVMESLIGAIYCLDGMEAARCFILSLWKADLSNTRIDLKHPKSEVQEWAAMHRYSEPQYELISQSGPAHALIFTVRLSINMIGSCTASASTKQRAESDAAYHFIQKFIRL